ncbi:hypothetical protein FC72_GL001905 [Companilactobacillus tucceti DSM 20183]|uniref:CAAX prenyl protease 2/Lysostaphin resistance protein A-like domain-containing protein n=1 Tax=Companilactobacillus tucceti DSM 20183 TaxID=1423811 RepID=A0A0R1J7M3_9LACO|nr:CPBP family intramembrane glutamic endopeptidase [Companilactobacillus tucceti]KRK64851.1 hypothetical protein FC72_GL001905 [Companilactobacillus tucceti DSM 20183]
MLKPEKKDSIVVTLICLMLIYVGLSLISGFIFQVILKINNFYIPSKIIVSIGILFYLTYTKKVTIFKNGNFKYGLYTILMTVLLTLLLNFQIQIPTLNHLNSLLLLPISSGIFEETIFRVLGIYIIGYFSSNLYLKIYLSSIIFGIAHLLNIISLRQDLFQTIIQVGYAIGLGTIFAISYISTKNIAFAMIAHVLSDFISGLNGLSFKTNIVFNFTSVSFILLFIMVVIILNYGFIKNNPKLTNG